MKIKNGIIVFFMILVLLSVSCNKKSTQASSKTEEETEADIYAENEAHFSAMWAAMDAMDDLDSYENILNGDLSEFSAYQKITSVPFIQIGRATEEILSGINSFYEYIDADNTGEWIVIWTDIYVMDFAFISVDYDYDADSWVTDVIYSIKEWSPEMPFLVNTSVDDGMPSRGITFKNPNKTHISETQINSYFYISESSFDGSLLLSEFKQEN